MRVCVKIAIPYYPHRNIAYNCDDDALTFEQLADLCVTKYKVDTCINIEISGFKLLNTDIDMTGVVSYACTLYSTPSSNVLDLVAVVTPGDCVDPLSWIRLKCTTMPDAAYRAVQDLVCSGSLIWPRNVPIYRYASALSTLMYSVHVSNGGDGDYFDKLNKLGRSYVFSDVYHFTSVPTRVISIRRMHDFEVASMGAALTPVSLTVLDMTGSCLSSAMWNCLSAELSKKCKLMTKINLSYTNICNVESFGCITNAIAGWQYLERVNLSGVCMNKRCLTDLMSSCNKVRDLAALDHKDAAITVILKDCGTIDVEYWSSTLDKLDLSYCTLTPQTITAFQLLSSCLQVLEVSQIQVQDVNDLKTALIKMIKLFSVGLIGWSSDEISEMLPKMNAVCHVRIDDSYTGSLPDGVIEASSKPLLVDTIHTVMNVDVDVDDDE